jgi:hypothetical protein
MPVVRWPLHSGICTPDPGSATVTQGGTICVVENEQSKQKMRCVFQKYWFDEKVHKLIIHNDSKIL